MLAGGLRGGAMRAVKISTSAGGASDRVHSNRRDRRRGGHYNVAWRGTLGRACATGGPEKRRVGSVRRFRLYSASSIAELHSGLPLA